MESEKQRTEQAFQQARMLKAVATVIALVLLIVVVGWGACCSSARTRS